MADDSQGGGILSSIGSGLGSLGTFALKYGVPLAAGAAMGGPIGALAGLGEAAGGNQRGDIEFAEKQASIRHMEMENQQLEASLQSEQALRDLITKTVPADQQVYALADPKEWVKQSILSNQVKTGLNLIPDNQVSPDIKKAVGAMPPEWGKSIVTDLMNPTKGAYHTQPYKSSTDGKWYVMYVTPNNPSAMKTFEVPDPTLGEAAKTTATTTARIRAEGSPEAIAATARKASAETTARLEAGTTPAATAAKATQEAAVETAKQSVGSGKPLTPAQKMALDKQADAFALSQWKAANPFKKAVTTPSASELAQYRKQYFDRLGIDEKTIKVEAASKTKLPEGASLVPNKTTKSGAPVYKLPDGSYWTP